MRESKKNKVKRAIRYGMLVCTLMMIIILNNSVSIAAIKEFETEIRSTVSSGKTILGTKYKFEVEFDEDENLVGFDAKDIRVSDGKISSFTKVVDGIYAFEVTDLKGTKITVTVPDGVVLSGDDTNKSQKFTVNVDKEKKAKAHLTMEPVKDVYKTGDEIKFTLKTDDGLLLSGDNTSLNFSGAKSSILKLTPVRRSVGSLFKKEGAKEFTGTYLVPYEEGEIKIVIKSKDLADNEIDTVNEEYISFKIEKKELELIATKDAAGKVITFNFNDKVIIDKDKIFINGEALTRGFSKGANDLTYTYKLDFAEKEVTTVLIKSDAIKTGAGSSIKETTLKLEAGTSADAEIALIGFQNRLNSINSVKTLDTFINDFTTFANDNKKIVADKASTFKDIVNELIKLYTKYIEGAFSSTVIAKEMQYATNEAVIKEIFELKEKLLPLAKEVGITDVSSLNIVKLDFQSKNTISLVINDTLLKYMNQKEINFKFVKTDIVYDVPNNFATSGSSYRLKIENTVESNEYTSYTQIGNSHILSLLVYDTAGKALEKELENSITITMPISVIGDVYYEYARGAYKNKTGETTAYDFNVTAEKITAKITKPGIYFIFESKEKSDTTNPESKVPFTDIEKHWAKEYIMMLVDEGITNGITKDKFGPSQNVTRSQAATFMVKACNLTLSDKYNAKFKDVAQGKWYTKYVETAAINKMINGYTNGTFKPDGNLTRQEMIVIIMKAYENNTGVSVSKIPQTVTFKDESQIAAWALPSIKAATSLGIVAGDKEGNFKPLNNITRAEVSKIIATYLVKVRSF